MQLQNSSRPAPPDSDNLLAVSGLRKSYREGGKPLSVLDGVDLAVAPGERVALLGRSGSGKSTLLNLLGGIDRADAGEVRILDTALDALDERQRTLFRRRHIGFIYQSFNLIPTLTAVENVALPLELNDVPAQQADAEATALLQRIGLAPRAGAFPDVLSGGEQQRVAVARALVHRPALVLADEPTGNLDAASGRQVLALLMELCDVQGSALLIATHSLAVSRSTDRVLSLVDGRLGEATGDLAW